MRNLGTQKISTYHKMEFNVHIKNEIYAHDLLYWKCTHVHTSIHTHVHTFIHTHIHTHAYNYVLDVHKLAVVVACCS